MQHHRRSALADPATSTFVQFAALSTIGARVVANAHQRGLAAMNQTRERHTEQAWDQSLTRARRSAADALSVARSAVGRVHELEDEVERLRRAVASRDLLIRSLKDG